MKLIDYNEQTKVAVFSYHDVSDIAKLPTMTKLGDGDLKNIGYINEGSRAVNDTELKMYSLTADDEWVEYSFAGGGGGGGTAINTTYDNTDSGLDADNVQDAIDETIVKANPTLEGDESSLSGLEIGGTKYSIPETDISGKMDKSNPAGSGSFSLNRKADTTVGNKSTTEGNDCTASGEYSHAEGNTTTASYSSAHAEGYQTVASGYASHTEGFVSHANGQFGHAEGYDSSASGYASHAEGGGTIAASEFQHAGGKYNIEDTDKEFAFIIGNGYIDTETEETVRSNAMTVDWDGNGVYSGKVNATNVPTAPTTDGTYNLQLTKENNTETYNWAEKEEENPQDKIKNEKYIQAFYFDGTQTMTGSTGTLEVVPLSSSFKIIDWSTAQTDECEIHFTDNGRNLLVPSHKYFVKFSAGVTTIGATINMAYGLHFTSGETEVGEYEEIGSYSYTYFKDIVTIPSTVENPSIYMVISQFADTESAILTTIITNPELIDLTDFFGEGKEPTTIAEVEAVFSDYYYKANDKSTSWLSKKANVNHAEFTGSISLGRQTANGTGYCSIAVGSGPTANGSASAAFGSSTTAHGANSLAVGNWAVANGTNSVAFGFNTTASGENSLAMGQGCSAAGARSFAGGSSCFSNPDCFTFGQTNNANGSAGGGTALFGANNLSQGFNQFIAGQGNKIGSSGQFSAAFGQSHDVWGKHSFVAGEGHRGGTNNIAIFGKFATDQSDQSNAFVIGNGSDANHRSNSLVFTKTGNLTIIGNITANNIPAEPANDGTYVLKCSKVDGVATYSWEAE